MMFTRTLFVIGLLFVTIWLSWTCKDDVNGDDTALIVFPDSNISYSKQVQPLFDRACAFSGCHDVETFDQRGYSLDSYENATHRVGIIVRGSPDASLLIGTIEGKSPPKMPPPPR
ncbi:MAG: hypothetical protein HY277_05455, partial [Ignavibacteriales bacterium]|nr:hypothetical protein [Ignavibacteriales bacterium]